MKTNLQKLAVLGITDIFRPLLKVAPDAVLTADFFHTLGWDIDALLDGNLAPLTAVITDVEKQIGQVEQLVGVANAPGIESFSDLRTALQTTKGLGQALKQLTTLNLAGNLANELYSDVLQKLVSIYLLTQQDKLYQFFTVTGIITPEITTIQLNGRYIKYVSQVPLFSFDRLLDFLKSPKQRVAAEYWPNGIADFATTKATSLVAQKLLPRLTNFLTSLGLPAAMANADMPGIALSIEETEALKSTITLSKILSLPGQGTLQLGAYLGLLSAQNQGPGVFVTPYGAASFGTYLGEWLVQLQLASGIGTLVLKQDSVALLGNSISPEGSIRLLVSRPGDNTEGVGNQKGTSLQLGNVQAGISLTFTTISHIIDIYVSLASSTLTIYPDEGDSFINKIIPAKGLNIKFNALLGWSSAKGLYFGGLAGLKNSIPVTSTRAEKVLKITSLTTELVLTDKLAVYATASGEVTLGPITVSVSEIGLTLDLAATPGGGNVGPFNVSLGFKAPTGVGIVVDSDALKGGGFLYLDPARHQYAGVAQLSFRDKLSLTAVGLLQTELPGNPDAYSLLLLITAEFRPIQLGLGFTLNGVGGLLGVNRAVNLPFLRERVRTGGVEYLLFPANVLADAAAVLALADGSFPATEGRYVLGLMAKIGWGTPNLLTLDVGLIIELPAPVRLVLLGVLRATLPSKDQPLVRLRADFLGSADFGAKRYEFDITLSDSYVLSWSLSGDGAFRLYQGEQPVFVLTTGGFHPAFQPPANANLPALRRLTLALAGGGDFRLTLQAYLAITSNTAQVGARADLYVGLPASFYIEAFLYFDTLFQFNPFRLDVRIGAGVAIKRNGRDKLSLYLELRVTGPAPWHVTGQVSFRILFIRVRFSIDRTLGGGAPAQPLPDVRVRELLAQALAAPTSWEVQAPAGQLASPVSLRASGGADSSRLLVDPRGALVVRQKVTPLAFGLERYGNARPVGGNRFELSRVELGVAGGPNPLVLTGSGLEEVRDFFAPGEFLRLTDAQRLSFPSFQLMRSGVRLGALDGLSGGPATVQQVGYEQIILGELTPGPVAPASPVAVIGSAEGEGRRRLRLPAEQVAQLAANGAIARAYAPAEASLLAPAAVGWQEEGYALARADSLTPYAADNTAYRSQAEARQALRALTAKNPALHDELLVLATYELAAVG